MYIILIFTDINTAGFIRDAKNRAEMGADMGNKYVDATALTIAIIGAINWGLIGLFRFDLVAFIFGDMSWLSRIVYTHVGT